MRDDENALLPMSTDPFQVHACLWYLKTNVSSGQRMGNNIVVNLNPTLGRATPCITQVYSIICRWTPVYTIHIEGRKYI